MRSSLKKSSVLKQEHCGTTQGPPPTEWGFRNRQGGEGGRKAHPTAPRLHSAAPCAPRAPAVLRMSCDHTWPIHSAGPVPAQLSRSRRQDGTVSQPCSGGAALAATGQTPGQGRLTAGLAGVSGGTSQAPALAPRPRGQQGPSPGTAGVRRVRGEEASPGSARGLVTAFCPPGGRSHSAAHTPALPRARPSRSLLCAARNYLLEIGDKVSPKSGHLAITSPLCTPPPGNGRLGCREGADTPSPPRTVFQGWGRAGPDAGLF